MFDLFWHLKCPYALPVHVGTRWAKQHNSLTRTRPDANMLKMSSTQAISPWPTSSRNHSGRVKTRTDSVLVPCFCWTILVHTIWLIQPICLGPSGSHSERFSHGPQPVQSISSNAFGSARSGSGCNLIFWKLIGLISYTHRKFAMSIDPIKRIDPITATKLATRQLNLST